MVPEDDEAIEAAVRAKLAALDARLASDAVGLDDEGRASLDALRRAAGDLSRAIEATEGNEP